MQRITPPSATPMMTVIAVDGRDQFPHPLIDKLVHPVLERLERDHQIEWLLPEATAAGIAAAHEGASNPDDRIIWVGLGNGVNLVAAYLDENRSFWGGTILTRFDHPDVSVTNVVEQARACFRRMVTVLG